MNTPAKDTSPTHAQPGAVNDLATQSKFVEKAELQLKEWGYQIEGLVAAAAKLGGAERQVADVKVTELQAKVAVARQKLTASKSLVNQKWLEARAGIEAVWAEVMAVFAKHGVHRPGEDDITEKYPV